MNMNFSKIFILITLTVAYCLVSDIIILNHEIAKLTNKFTSNLLNGNNKIIMNDKNFIPNSNNPYKKTLKTFNAMNQILGQIHSERISIREQHKKIYKQIKQTKYNIGKIDTPEKLFNGNLQDVMNFFSLGIIRGESANNKFFDDLLHFTKNSKIHGGTKDLVKFVKYFINEQKKLNDLNVEGLIAALRGPDGLLFNLRGAFGQYSVKEIPMLLQKIKENRWVIPKKVNDDISFAALGLLCSGITMYIKTMCFLIEGHQFLANAYFHKGNLFEYNQNLEEQFNLFRDLSGLYNSPIDTVKIVLSRIKQLRHSQFVKTNIHEFADQYIKILDNIKSFLSKDFVFSADYTIDIRYNFALSTVETPIGIWESGKKLRYAIQLKQKDSNYFGLTEWSKYYTIQGKANPVIYFKSVPRGVERLILRQIGDVVELVGVLNNTQREFHDIDRDVYNSASNANEEIAVREIEILVRANKANVNSKFDNGRSAIHAAVENGHRNLSEILLNEFKVNINTKDDSGYAPLHLASKNGDLEMIKLLIKKGADINCTTQNRWTPLHFAARDSDYNTIKYLISEGADDKARTDEELTPLHIGVLYENIEAIQLLLLKNNYSYSNFEFTPLHLAILNGNLDIVKELSERDSKNVYLNKYCKGGFAPMHLTVLSGSLEVLEYLLRNRNIIFESISDQLWTPLHLSIILNRRSITDRLLEDHRTNINSKNNDGLTPLHLAVIKGDTITASKLIDIGVSLTSIDIDGKTPLHLAAENGNLDLIKLLIESGSNMNSQDNYQFTPVNLAVFNRQLAAVRYLVNNEVDINIPNAAGMTPIDIAASTKDFIINEIFLKKGNSSLHYAAFSGNIELVWKLIKMGYDVNEIDDAGRTALHKAVIGENFQIIRDLRNNKNYNNQAIPDIRDKFGNTPRHLAALTGNYHIFEYFSKIGVSSEEGNNDYNTLLHLAARSGNVRVLKKVFENYKTIAINSQNIDNYTSLHIASIHGHENIVNFLVDQKNANVFILDNFGRSPLFEAARFSHWNIVEKLSQKLHTNEDFNTYANIINFAIRDGQENIIQWIEDHGLNVNFQDKNSRSFIFRAVAQNSLTLVKVLVEKGANLLSHGQNEVSLLHEASSIGNLELVVYLVEEKYFDINLKTNNTRITPLHLSASNGHTDIVQYLVESGSNIDATDINNATALLRAALNGHWDTARYLIDNGADTNIQNNDGNNILHITVQQSSFAFTEYLLRDNYIDAINTINNRYMSALQIAIKLNNIKLATLLIKNGANINLVDHQGNNILHWLSFSGNLPAMNFYRYFVSIDGNFATNKQRLSPIHIAAGNGYLNIIKHYEKENENFCLDRYKKINKCLLLAAENGHLRMIKYLYEKNKIENISSIIEESILAASMKGHLLVVKYLFSKYKVDINFKVKNESSLVATSCQHGHLPVVRFLVENGASLNNNEYCGLSPVILASKFGHLSVVRYLVDEKKIGIENQDDSGKTPLIWASINGHVPLVKYLISKNVSIIFRKDNENRNSLIWVTCLGKVDIVQLFISKYQGNINTLDNDGLHLPMVACERGHFETVQFFTYYKHVDVNLVGKNGMTCLLFACSGGYLKTVKFMLRSGSYLEITNDFGDTPLMLACRNGDLNLIMYLIEEHNVNIYVKNNFGHTAITQAGRAGHFHVIKYFFEEKVIRQDKEMLFNLLQISIHQGHLDIAKYLIDEKGIDISGMRFDFDPLRVAIKRNHWKMVEYLLSKEDFRTNEQIYQRSIQHKIRVDPFFSFKHINKSSDENTRIEMLTIACKAGVFEIVKNLTKESNIFNEIDKFTNIFNKNIKDDEIHKINSSSLAIRIPLYININTIHRGSPIILYAVESGSLKLVKFLIEELSADYHAISSDEKNVLMVAAHFGYVHLLKYFIGLNYTGIKNKDYKGRTVLDYALFNGKASAVKYLIDIVQINLDVITTGVTAFFNAADKGFLKLLLYLTNEKSIDINLLDINKRNILMYASRGGHIALVKYLIKDKEMKANAKDQYGQTPLMFVTQNGHLDLVKYFVDDAKVIINEKDNFNRTALMHAVIHGHFTIVDYLIQGNKNVSSDDKDKIGNTCLMLASKSGFYHIFNRFLDIENSREKQYEDLNAKNNDGRNSLGLAVEGNNLPIVSYLIDIVKMNFHIKDNAGLTLLMIAAQNGYLNLVENIYHKDNRLISAIDNFGNSAMLHASLNGHFEVVKFLVERGDDVLVVNNENISPVEAAASKGYLPIVIYLIENKLKFDRLEISKTFIQACENSQIDIIRFLIDNKYITSINQNRVELVTLGNCDVSAIKYISERDINVTIKDEYESTLLHYASQEGNLKVVKYLIDEKGIDLNMKDDLGSKPYFYTAYPISKPLSTFYKQKRSTKLTNANKKLNPLITKNSLDVLKYFIVEKHVDIINDTTKLNKNLLMLAAEYSREEIVKYLLENTNIEIDKKDIFGKTALHYAIEGTSSEGNLNIVKYLIEQQASVNITDIKGENILLSAVSYERTHIVRYLLETTKIEINRRRTDGLTVLHLATNKGNLDFVKYLVEKGGDVNIRDNLGVNILMKAAFNYYFHIVMYLVENTKIEINGRDISGKTALYYATYNEHLTIVKYLIGKGANVNIRYERGENILMFAVFLKRFDMVKYLLEKSNIKMEKKDTLGRTALNHAISKGHVHIFKYLLEKGANIYVTNSEGRNVLMDAAVYAQFEIVKYVLEKSNIQINTRDEYNQTALHYATFCKFVSRFTSGGCLNIVKYLVGKGADVNVTNYQGKSPLIYASFKGMYEIVNFLLHNMYIEVDGQDNKGQTALLYATSAGHLSIVQLLIKKGANILIVDKYFNNVLMFAVVNNQTEIAKYIVDKTNIDLDRQNVHGKTALHHSVLNGQLLVMKYLVKKGANMNIDDYDGNSILIEAAFFGHLEILKYILNNSAIEINKKNLDGKTALYYAVSEGHLNIVNYLLEKGANVDNNILITAVNSHHLEIVRYLLDNKIFEVNRQDIDGNTALHYATSNGYLDIVKYLISKGADVHIGDAVFNENAFMAAASYGHLEIIKYLAEKVEINIDKKTNDGRTALINAIISFGNLDVVKYLVSKGANVNITDIRGHNSLMYASWTKKFSIVKYLVKETRVEVNRRANNGKTALHYATISGELDIVAYLISNGADENIISNDDTNILMIAALKGYIHIVKYLIEVKNVNINVRNKNGWDVLFFASNASQLEIVKYLIEEKGVDFLLKDNSGRSLLMLASDQGQLDVVEFYFRETRINVNDQDNDGMSALMLAIVNGYLNVVKYLLDEARAKLTLKNKLGENSLMIAAKNGRLSILKYLVEEKGVDCKQLHGGTSDVVEYIKVNCNTTGDGNIDAFLIAENFTTKNNRYNDSFESENTTRIVNFVGSINFENIMNDEITHSKNFFDKNVTFSDENDVSTNSVDLEITTHAGSISSESATEITSTSTKSIMTESVGEVFSTSSESSISSNVSVKDH